MSILDKKYYLKANISTSKIEEKNIQFYNTDRNTAILYLKLKYIDDCNLEKYFTSQMLDGYTIKLTVVKPKTLELVELDGVKENDMFKFELPSNFTDQVGKCVCEIIISNTTEDLTLDEFVYKVKESATTKFNAEIIPNPDLPILKQLIEEVKSEKLRISNIDDVNVSNTMVYSSAKVENIKSEIDAQFNTVAKKSEVGTPLVAKSVTEMIDTTKVYVYTGSEEGYTSGNWYSYNGSFWVSGGVYNSQGIGDNSIEPKNTTFLIEGENKLNIISIECEHGYYLNWDNTKQSKEGVSISHKIPVKNGDIICFSRCHLTSTNWGLLYDSKGNKLAGLNSIGEEHDENEDAYKYKKVTITNENASYIRINFLNNDLKVKPMLFFSETFPLEYMPYKFKIDNIIDLNLGQSVNYNVLEGKSVLTFGDSVMYGAGGTVGAFAKMIADKNNMSLTNKAKSGYTICVSVDYPNRGSILKEVETSIANNDTADYILIEGGFNDVFVKSKCPLGIISADYTTFDNATFSGALESLFKQVLVKWYDKKILFILGHQLYRSLNDTTTPFDYWVKNQNTYWDRAIDICKKWNVPFLDMRLSGFIPLTDTLLATYFAESNQSTHPNDLGYKLIYVDKVESKMKSL